MPSQVFTAHAVAKAEARQVWSALQNPETWREIGGVNEVANPTFDEVGLTGYDFTVTAGGKSYGGQARRVEASAHQRMVMKIATDQLDGQVTVDLGPLDAHTEVGVTMEIASRGFLAGVMFSVISNSVAKGYDAAVERFVDSLD